MFGTMTARSRADKKVNKKSVFTFSVKTLFIIYIVFYAVLSLLTAGILKRKSFIARYKEVNRYNVKYLFWPDNEPYPKMIGKCRIEKMYGQGNKFLQLLRFWKWER